MILDLEQELEKKKIKKKKELTPEQIEKQRESARKAMRKWRANNPEKAKRRRDRDSLKYRLENTELCNQRASDYYYKKQDEYQQKALDYYYKNREKILQKQKEKREREKEINREIKKERAKDLKERKFYLSKIEINTKNAEGIKRKIGKSGKIVLPIEFRRELGLEPEDLVKVYLLKDGFYIKKY